MKRFKIGIALLLTLVVGVAVLGLLKYGSMLGFFFLYPWIYSKVTGAVINPHLANMVALIAAAGIYFGLYVGIYKRNKNLGYACLIGLLVIQSLFMFISEKNRFFSLNSGIAIKYYTVNPLTGEFQLFDREVYDALGQKARPVDFKTAQAIYRQQNSKQYPNTEVEIKQIANFFDVYSGRALVYYCQNDLGYHFFLHDGYDPFSGSILLPVTTKVVDEAKWAVTRNNPPPKEFKPNLWIKYSDGTIYKGPAFKLYDRNDKYDQNPKKYTIHDGEIQSYGMDRRKGYDIRCTFPNILDTGWIHVLNNNQIITIQLPQWVKSKVEPLLKKRESAEQGKSVSDAVPIFFVIVLVVLIVIVWVRNVLSILNKKRQKVLANGVIVTRCRTKAKAPKSKNNSGHRYSNESYQYELDLAQLRAGIPIPIRRYNAESYQYDLDVERLNKGLPLSEQRYYNEQYQYQLDMACLQAGTKIQIRRYFQEEYQYNLDVERMKRGMPLSDHRYQNEHYQFQLDIAKLKLKTPVPPFRNNTGVEH